jgi:hypothetical protein
MEKRSLRSTLREKANAVDVFDCIEVVDCVVFVFVFVVVAVALGKNVEVGVSEYELA